MALFGFKVFQIFPFGSTLSKCVLSNLVWVFASWKYHQGSPLTADIIVVFSSSIGDKLSNISGIDWALTPIKI